MEVQLARPVKAERPIKNTAANSGTAMKRNEQLVYDALCQSQSPLKAYDILEKLQDNGLKAPMTIYRALDALIARGCVRKIESLNAFVAVGFSQTTKAHAFLICRECMRAKEIKLDDQQVADLFAPLLVSMQDIRIEAFADCSHVCGGQTRGR